MAPTKDVLGEKHIQLESIKSKLKIKYADSLQYKQKIQQLKKELYKKQIAIKQYMEMTKTVVQKKSNLEFELIKFEISNETECIDKYYKTTTTVEMSPLNKKISTSYMEEVKIYMKKKKLRNELQDWEIKFMALEKRNCATHLSLTKNLKNLQNEKTRLIKSINEFV